MESTLYSDKCRHGVKLVLLCVQNVFPYGLSQQDVENGGWDRTSNRHYEKKEKKRKETDLK